MQEQKPHIDGVPATIPLSAAQQSEFVKAIKIGIYKELHKKELLTDAQLKLLLKAQS